jgi:EAL domain-containing protein (putative c-di-GMP-specific phosphodiesterase class I)
VYQPAACLEKTFEAAERAHFPLHHLIFEVTENEPSRDVGHLQDIFTEYTRHGMITAIDDFGAGHSGLNMLADFQPDVIKIDMALTRAINTDPVRYEITRAVVGLCARLHISVVRASDVMNPARDFDPIDLQHFCSHHLSGVNQRRRIAALTFLPERTR